MGSNELVYCIFCTSTEVNASHVAPPSFRPIHMPKPNACMHASLANKSRVVSCLVVMVFFFLLLFLCLFRPRPIDDDGDDVDVGLLFRAPSSFSLAVLPSFLTPSRRGWRANMPEDCALLPNDDGRTTGAQEVGRRSKYVENEERRRRRNR